MTTKKALKILLLTATSLLCLGFITVLATAWIPWSPGYTWLYAHYPEHFRHRDFYVRCKQIKPGMSLASARQQMGDFLEVGRTWNPPTTDAANQFRDAESADITESTTEHDSRIIFVPDAHNT